MSINHCEDFLGVPARLKREAEQRAVRNSRLEEYTRARLEKKRKQEIREADGKQYDRG